MRLFDAPRVKIFSRRSCDCIDVARFEQNRAWYSLCYALGMKPISQTHVLRACLLIAIIAGLAISANNLILTKTRIHELRAGYQRQVHLRQQAESDLDRTTSELGTVFRRLQQTQSTLETAIGEREAAVMQASADRERAKKLDGRLSETLGQLDAVQTKLALYEISGLKPEQVAAMGNHVKNLQTQLARQQAENQQLAQQLHQWQELYPDESVPVTLPADLRGQVLVSDPKWHFVVINAGEDQGVKLRGQLLVSRNGKLVGRAIVRRVEKNRSIADLVRSAQLSEVAEGDSIFPAEPRS